MIILAVILIIVGVIYDKSTNIFDDTGLWIALLGVMIGLVSSSGQC